MEESIILNPDAEKIMASGEKMQTCFRSTPDLDGVNVTAQPCFVSIMDTLFSATLGSSTSSLVLVIFIAEVDGV